MASDFTGKQIYQQDFDPTDYLETYYGAGKGVFIKDGFMEFALRKLHEAFTTGGVKGDTLIDIGPGPAIYQELSACEAFKEIIAADFTDRNRQYLSKWLKNEPGMFDWTPAVKFVCELEGRSDNIVGKQEKLRKTLKRIVKCDVTKSNPLEPLLLPQVDCVTTLGCLECACKDHDTYRKVLRNLSSLLKVGGCLIVTDILGSTSFLSGTKRFSLLNLDEAFIRKAITDAGFAIEDLEVLKRDFDKEMFDVCDHTSSIFYVARKVKEVK